MKQERYNEIAEKLIQAIDSQVEYNERHQDAGDEYAHLPFEGGWDYNGTDKKIREYFKNERNTYIGDEIAEAIAEKVRDYDLIEMRPGSVFGMYGTESDCIEVEAYPIQEMEMQFYADDSWVHGLLDCTEEEFKEFWDLAKQDNEFCISGDCCYACTDAVWFAVVTLESIQEMYEEVLEQIEED